MVDFTVAIPTYNGENRLSKVLEQLEAQVGTENFTWEIIVVDNNSSDNTAKVVQKYQQSWSHRCQLRYCFEAKQGLAFARQRAIKESQGIYIGFLDDDVLPAFNWVLEAYSFGQKHPNAGVFGGRIHGSYEAELPANFNKIEGFLALRDRGDEPNLYEPEILSLPPGAAAVYRKEAWCNSVPNCLKFQGRNKTSMMAGEDFEVMLYIYKTGWEIWYNPAMFSYHQIPYWRLERSYLISLIRGCCLPLCYLRLINTKTWKKPWIIFKMLFGNFYKAIMHFLKYRSQVRTNLVIACELEIFLSISLGALLVFKRDI